MTKTKKILPQEWIQEYFSPVVGVLTTTEVDALCHKNNLTMVEMLQPFSKLMTDVTLKDPEGANHPVASLSVTFQDFQKDPTRSIGPRLLSDTVSSLTEEPLVARTFPARSLQIEAPGFTPWFDAWTKIYLQSLPCVDHEFLRHHIGCVFVVSSSSRVDPLEELRNLVQIQHKRQHERSSSGPGGVNMYPQYFSPHILKYYVLLHDVYSVEESRAHEIYKQMQTAFGSASCHLLQFNSRTTQNDGDDGNPNVAEHWISMTYSHRFSHIETRLKAVSGDSVLIPPSNKVTADQQDSNNSKSTDELDHPLAAVSEDKTPPLSPSVIVPKLVPITKDNIAIYLTYNDIDRIRILIREFVIKGLIPHVEKQLRLLYEIVTNRKSRSLFSGAKRWFGQSKPGVATGTSVIYGREAPELQIRKLGDLYFMLKLYKHSYTYYHTAKKDFQNDEAWNYYAGAAEMCALAQFMQGDAATKKYPAHYMEDSITKYLQVCQMPEFAIRASLFDAMCLKYQGMFQESALSYVRMSKEGKDLRSGLVLEQAAYCYLLSNPPLVRKYAFHIILSGYRFSKSGQKKHSSRTYRQGFQVYKGHGWELSENHILYTLGHQSLLLKDHYTAASLFNELVATTNIGLNPLQQMCHLREFFIVHHMREKEDKAVATVTIPFFKSQQCILDLTGGLKPHETLVDQVIGTKWQNLEKTVVEHIHANTGDLNLTCQTVFGPHSHNLLVPQAAVDERIRLLIPVSNPFQTPLLMTKVRLIWKFVPEVPAANAAAAGDDEPSSAAIFSNGNNPQAAAGVVKTEIVESVTLEKDIPVVLDMGLTALKEGELSIHGIEYSLKALFPQSEATDYTIRGKQALKVVGPRLNLTKDEKVSKTPLYMKDNRLACKIVPLQPKLEVSLKLPEVMFQGEVQTVDLELRNVGNAPLTQLFLAHHCPGLFSFGGKRAKKPTLFDYPLIRESVVNDGYEANKLLDIIPIPLEDDLHPGKSTKLKLWLCAPYEIGGKMHSIYFAYNIPTRLDKKPLKRMLRHDVTFKVLASAVITANQVHACLHDDNKSQALLVHMSNTSKEGKTQQLEQAYVWQVSLISNHRKLSCFVSSNENAPILKGESLVLGLKTAQINDTTQSSSDGFHFSTLHVGKDHNSQTTCIIESPPYIDFLKRGFDYPNVKDGPQLRSDLIVVIWRASNGKTGLLFTPITADDGAGSTGDQVDGGQTDVMSTTDSIDCPLPAPKKACRVKATNSRNFKHDFSLEPICLVPFTVTIENYLPTPSVFRYKADNRDMFHTQEMGRFLGCTRATVPFEGQVKKSLNFHVAVSSPGLYTYNGLRFQMTEVNEPCDDDEFIPLEVNFIVD